MADLSGLLGPYYRPSGVRKLDHLTPSEYVLERDREEEGLEAPPISPDDFLGAGALKAAVAGAVSLASLLGLMKFGGKQAPKTVKMYPGQRGATGWHGSPHKFAKFDLAKIGTGEGAQAYGHGVYLAEAKDVADSYAGMLSPTPRLSKQGEFFDAQKYNDMLAESRAAGAGSLQKAIESSRRALQDLPKNGRGKSLLEESGQEISETGLDISKERNILASLLRLQRKGYEVTNGGHLYKTDIPDEAVARFLDWDKPLSQQAPEVQKAIERSPYAMRDMAMSITGSKDPLGGEVVKTVMKPDELAKHLQELGVPGIRYLDGGSRGTGKGTSNYVVFDPEMIRILERNGEATGLQPWKPGEWRGLISDWVP